MKKSTIVTFGILAIVLGSILAFASNTYAYRGDPSVKGPYHTEEREALMEKAFDNNDFNAWKALMVQKGRVTQVINKDNFAQFAKAHKLVEEGKIAEANKIRESLGLGLRNGSGYGMGGRHAR